MAEDPYSAAPLNLRHREIRLVQLDHSEAPEPIRCSLRSYRLDDRCPSYVALSYAWGPKERRDDLHVNSVAFPVGRSLWSFLHELRLQDQSTTIWIDAISIDQSDVLEQNHQVQIMRDIYANAQSAWIWLGEADSMADSDVAMQHIETREPLGDREIAPWNFWSQKEARAVLALCKRKYWTRIWFVQEIMLAKRATIMCGKEQVSWEKLQQLILDLLKISNEGLDVLIIGVLEALASAAAVIVRAKSQWNGSHNHSLPYSNSTRTNNPQTHLTRCTRYTA